MTSRPLRTLAGPAAGLLGGLVALALAWPAGTASATKEYARKEKKDCSYCHVSDKGAGPRNERGKEYEANGHRFGVDSWSTDENRKIYLLANAAYLAGWYGRAWSLLHELEEREELPGGLALIEGRRDRMKMFPRAWLRAARALLRKGDRGVGPAVSKFLVRLESQFPDSDEGEEATELLDELAENEEHAEVVETERKREDLRLLLLEARMEAQLGHWDRVRTLCAALADEPLAEPFEDDLTELREQLPAE